MPSSIFAAAALIVLSGVTVLDGLVVLTQILSLIDGGAPRAQAIRDGALARFGPVVMASLGFVPMELTTGARVEVQKPLATVVIGRLLTAADRFGIVTLLSTPIAKMVAMAVIANAAR